MKTIDSLSLKTKVAASVVATIAFFQAAFAADFQVIANSGVSDTSLSKDKVSSIYMGKAKSWPSGIAVKPCQLKANNDATESFLDDVGISEKKYKRHWRKMLFSGNGQPPAVLGSDDEMVQFVKDNEGAIGFVSAGADVSKVKVITLE